MKAILIQRMTETSVQVRKRARNTSTVIIFLLLSTALHQAQAQFGFNSKRETYAVTVAHPPDLVLPNVKRVAIVGFVYRNACGQELKDQLSEKITGSGTFDLIDRSSLGTVLSEQDLQTSAFADPANAIRLGKLLGPTAIITGNVTRCDADTSEITAQQGYRDRKGYTPTYYSRATTAHLAVTVQVIDVATSKVVLFRTFASTPVQQSTATDQYPAIPDGGVLLEQAILNVQRDVGHLLLPWSESVNVTVHADKECDLKPAAEQIRTGDFAGAAETMRKAIERQCDAPNDKIALAKAYHNRGVALTYAGQPDEGLKSLEEANSLWPGNIAQEAIAATQKIIQARAEQQRQDLIAANAAKVAAANAQATVVAAQTAEAARLSNKDVIDMVQAKLSDKIVIGKIRTTQCRFDTSPSALIQLKKSGASDAVVVALTEAQCGK